MIQKQFQAVGTFWNRIRDKKDLGKKIQDIDSQSTCSHFNNLKSNGQKPLFYNSVEALPDRSPVQWPLPGLEPR